jgi:serine/threonine protein kinase
LKDCHSSNIIHRDIKPQNIIVDDSLQEIKIIDFGLSLNVSKNMEIKHYRRCGTMGYMSPEVFANRRDQMKPYGFKSDLFSFGIIAHMLLLGFNPLKGRNYE